MFIDKNLRIHLKWKDYLMFKTGMDGLFKNKKINFHNDSLLLMNECLIILMSVTAKNKQTNKNISHRVSD